MTRDGIWHLVKERPELLEFGLRVVVESVDCTNGSLDPAEGLARDAVGVPTMVFAIAAVDAQLVARLLAAHAFLQRNAQTLARAIPEADFRGEGRFRLLVAGADLTGEAIELLQRLGVPELEVVAIERFRAGGQERFAVRTVLGGAASASGAAVPDGVRRTWDALVAFLGKLDPNVRLLGDRFSRRATFRGRALCEFACSGDRLTATLPGLPERVLGGPEHVPPVADLVLRRYLDVLAETAAAQSQHAAPQPAPAAARSAAPAPAGGTRVHGSACQPAAAGDHEVSLESLRAALVASRLTREEESALGLPTAEEDLPGGG